MLGQAAIAMWWNIAPDVRAQWEHWHTVEHMPERLGIPGFLRGTRCVGLADPGAYFVLYEAAALATVTTGKYLERLNNPTPWSREMMPHHRNMVRSLCLVRESYGTGLAHAMATVRFSGAVPDLPKGKGITSAALLESQPMPGAPTTEQKIRGGDATVDKALLIGGYDADAVRHAAQGLALPGAALDVYRVSYSLSPS
ncbi:MAG TPA: hypothetical protein VM183_00250 [Burkholderiales bacterium]|nr:hypothetical protein [Burkholderiales bacterium]